MHLLSLRKSLAMALAASALCAAAPAVARGTVEVFNHAVMGSADFGYMGYDEEGHFIDLTGQKILGGWVEVEFTPAGKRDSKVFTMQMLVPVEGPSELLFTVHASDLIPMGHGRYRAALTSNQYNGIIRAGRYSIETFGTNAEGERVVLQGSLSESTGFHFIVTKPD
jgi:hypothetical protein